MEDQMSDSERRRYVRVSSNLIVHVEEISGYGVAANGITKNISKGGMLFEYNRGFPLATILALDLRIPEMGKKIECYAKVVRNEEIIFGRVYDIGVVFINITEDDISLLKKYLEIKIENID